MRVIIPIVFIILIIALVVCAIVARKSDKPIGRAVALLDAALIPPMIGNLIIILSKTPDLSFVGCYFYFIGMNCAIAALLHFTVEYCSFSKKGSRFQYVLYGLLIADTIQLLCNMFSKHAFVLEKLDLSGELYYRFVPLFGQSIHRIIDYGIFAAVLIIFLVKMIRSPRVYLERYAVIFISMVVVGVWESFYIFSRTPIDRSMIGFGVFGLLVFYFSIFYRPRRLLDRMLVAMASELPDALLFFDLNKDCIWANRKGLEFMGVEEKDIDKIKGMLYELLGTPPSGDDWSEQNKITRDGETRYYFFQEKDVYDDRHKLAGKFVSIRDNTDELMELQNERYNATHDSVTGLYNREYFFEQIEKRLHEHPEVEQYIAVVSLNDLEVISDIYGTEFCEQALRQAADWLKVGIPDGSLYGRLGETELGACIPVEGFDFEYLEHELSHVIIHVDSVEQHIFIHFGVYKVTDPNMSISVMFDRARLALVGAQDDLSKTVRVYKDSLRDKIQWNHQISAELPGALEGGQIVPYLQPIVDASGKIIGAEALARWNHPTEGFLAPYSFIPVFEKNGLIADLDRYMWRCACEILAEWKKEQRDLFVSVNISPRDFEVVDVIEEFTGLVREFDIAPEHLRLEITESALITDQENRMKILNDLRSQGFLIEMDDFGSGYSSMNLLKDMPTDLVKLDMVFLQKSHDVERAKTIVHTIIKMVQRLGIISLMEGVETETQFHVLTDMGCELFQGFYFSKPVTVEQFRKLL